MTRKEIDPETANEIKKELDELRKILETQRKAVKTVGQKKSKASSLPPEPLFWDDPYEKMPYEFISLIHKSVPVCIVISCRFVSDETSRHAQTAQGSLT